MLANLNKLIERELTSLKAELAAYPDEVSLWEIPAGISNSGGTLALHLVGNLRHFIGANLGNSGYVRNRPAEFESRNVPRDEIYGLIDSAIAEVAAALTNLSPEKLNDRFPLKFGEISVQNGDFLLHLLSHLAYHLGQVNYHRRLVTTEGSSAGALSIPKLASARRDA